MNDCKHFQSLTPIPESDEYICNKCGWKFKILHVVDTEFEKLLEDKKAIEKKLNEKYGIPEKDWMVKAIEEALRSMGNKKSLK